MRCTDGKYAWSVKVGAKGQFVVPKEARDLFCIRSGDTLLLLGDKEQGLAIPPKGMFEELTKNMFNSKDSKEEIK